MARATYFVQECPTCGRHLEVRLEYLGKRVICNHCHGRFLATDHSPLASSESGLLLQRADQLLALAEQQLSHSSQRLNDGTWS